MNGKQNTAGWLTGRAALAADVQADKPVFDLAIGGITITAARKKTEEIPSLAADGRADAGKV